MTVQQRWVAKAVLMSCVVGSVVISPFAASAAPTLVQQAPHGASPAAVTQAKVAARVAMAGGPRLHVQVGPAPAGPGAWQFTLERLSGDSWQRVGDYRTVGSKGEAAIPVASGTYRVVLPAQKGYLATTSEPRPYRPTPDIAIGGYGALEVKVGPIRDWQVTLERKTDQGWTRATTAKTRGVTPVVFAVDAGTYRVRTDANGRFPASIGKPFDFVPRAPAGPMDLAVIDDAFSPASVSGRQVRALRSSTTGCGSVMNKTSDGLYVASGFLSVIPVAGSALAAVGDDAALWTGAAGSSAGSACVQAQFQTVNEQLGFQEQQIGQLQQRLRATQNAIIQAAYAAQVEITNSAAYDYDNAVNPLQALFTSFMVDGGFWSGPGTPIAGASVSTTATSPLAFSQLASLATGNQSTFTGNLDNMSGSSMGCSGSLLPPLSGSAPACYQAIALDTQSAVYQLYSDMYTQLHAEIADSVRANQNVVPLFDQYNQGLAAFYQQSLGVLQQAFSMEYAINQLNLDNGSAYASGQITKVAEIVSVGEVPGTYYSYPALKEQLGTAPTTAQQVASYNKAQKALAQAYVARVNQLYLLTVGYVVTDPPIQPQAWPEVSPSLADKHPNVVPSLDYAANVGRFVNAPMGMLPSVATNGSTWMLNAALYQYSGLRDVETCASSLKAYNEANGTNGVLIGPNGALNATSCPSILTTAAGTPVSASPVSSALTDCASYAATGGTSAGSCYDGNTVNPYSNWAIYNAATSGLAIGSTVVNNLMLCDDTNPYLTWFPVAAANAGNAAGLTAGMPILDCGNWGQTGSNQFPGSTQPAISGYDAQGNTLTVPWSDSSTLTSNFGMQVSYSTEWDYWALPNSPLAFTGNSYSPLGYYFPLAAQSTNNWWTYYNPASTTPPLNIGGPNETVTVQFPVNANDGTCSIASAVPDAPTSPGTNGVALDTGACTITFPGVSGSYDPSTSIYTGDTAMATVGLRLPNPMSGSAEGGFVLPVTIGVAAGNWGRQYVTQAGAYSDYCQGKNNPSCTLLAVWISAGTSIADVGFTAPPAAVSCDNPSTSPVAVSCSGIFTSQGAVTIADGNAFQFNVGRISDGHANFTVSPGG